MTKGWDSDKNPKDPEMHACFCIGPQNGQPLCPCQMRGVVERDGRYISITDLGPVKKYASIATPKCPKCRASLSATDKFCSECGAAQSVKT